MYTSCIYGNDMELHLFLLFLDIFNRIATKKSYRLLQWVFLSPRTWTVRVCGVRVCYAYYFLTENK